MNEVYGAVIEYIATYLAVAVVGAEVVRLELET